MFYFAGILQKNLNPKILTPKILTLTNTQTVESKHFLEIVQKTFLSTLAETAKMKTKTIFFRDSCYIVQQNKLQKVLL